MKRLLYRFYQTIMRIGSYFVQWRKPLLLKGENVVVELYKTLLENNYNNLLIVTDYNLVKLGLLDSLFESLKTNKITYTVYSKTTANPSVINVEEALILYKKNKCNAMIAFGGGSPIDCAKGVAARLARPKKSIQQLKGYLKVRKQIVPLIAIPTTAGSGSEATIAAVISDTTTHEKFAISDMALIPKMAVLDPLLTINLPKHITSTTGMDALTHAVEAYIGRSNTKETKQMAIDAINLIFNNLEKAYENPKDINARINMQLASYYAGISFTRAYVGYVHALAHQLGGFYSTPHGLANSVLLPNVLEYYGDTIYKKLAKLADLTKISKQGQTKEEKAKEFILKIKTMNKNMNIPLKIKEIKTKDLDIMVKRAYSEANPHYPVPKIINKKDLKAIYQSIM